MIAEIDSNEVSSTGTEGIWVWSGYWRYGHPGYYPRYGHVTLELTRNAVSCPARGVYAYAHQLVPGGAPAGDLFLMSEANRIEGSTTGFLLSGGLGTDAILDADVLRGAATCDRAIDIQEADSIRVINCDSILDWTNGIYIGSCTWAEITSNQLAGRQEGVGIRCVGSSPEIRDNYIDDFLTAIQAESDADPHVQNNSLACATDWGLNNISAGVVVDADSNYWGDPSGPYHPTANPSGTGSWVSDNVIFTPWLTDFPNRSPRPFSLLSPGPGEVLDTVPVFGWEDAVDPDCHDFVFYTLHISEDSVYSDPMVVPGLPESEYAFPESLFVGGAAYFWKVGATDGEDSIWCNENDWGFEVDAVPPGMPQQVAGEGLGTEIRVFWDPNPEGDLSFYSVYQGADSSFVISEAETVYGTSDTTITIAGLDSCTVYYYRVTAIDFASNESEASPALGMCPVGAGVEDDDIPVRFMVSRANPNPSLWGTRIAFALPTERHVRAAIYDVEGRLVETLVDEVYPPGRYGLAWGGEDARGHRVPPGVYFLQLKAGENTAKRKIVTLR
jgi:hypothetical protein